MRWFPVPLALLAAICIVGCGSPNPESDSYAGETTPESKKPPPTAEENAKAIAANPNISPEVKKVLGGAGR
jgi:hypothetical protein